VAVRVSLSSSSQGKNNNNNGHATKLAPGEGPSVGPSVVEAAALSGDAASMAAAAAPRKSTIGQRKPQAKKGVSDMYIHDVNEWRIRSSL
jgi:hypothetical protein